MGRDQLSRASNLAAPSLSYLESKCQSGSSGQLVIHLIHLMLDPCVINVLI